MNNIDNQLDVTITASNGLLIIPVSTTCFLAIILPIIRDTRLCYSLWYNAPMILPATGRQHRGCIIPQAVTHSLVPLKMGKIIFRNMLS